MSKTQSRDLEFPGSARASRALSGAPPECSKGTWYSKRRLPHFERPWAKHAVAFSTYQRRLLVPNERDIVLASICYSHELLQYELYAGCVESFDRLIRSESDLKEKFSYVCHNPWDSKIVDQSDEYSWLWTQEISSAGAPKAAREARALPKR